MSRCETVMQVVAKLLLMSSKMHLCYSLLHIAILYEQCLSLASDICIAGEMLSYFAFQLMQT